MRFEVIPVLVFWVLRLRLDLENTNVPEEHTASIFRAVDG
jgi:hypothetical protein